MIDEFIMLDYYYDYYNIFEFRWVAHQLLGKMKTFLKTMCWSQVN